MKRRGKLSRGRTIFDLALVLLSLPLLLLYIRNLLVYRDTSGTIPFAFLLALSFLLGLADPLLTLAGRRPKGDWWSVLLGIAFLAAISTVLLILLGLLFWTQLFPGTLSAGS